MDTLPAVRRTIARYRLIAPGDRVIVGVSGGPDSLCLLHLLCRLATEWALNLHVAHLDHGLRGADAAADAAFVAETAAAWGLPCTVGRADIANRAGQPGLSLEEAARLARYGFLGRLAAGLDAHSVAVGHNADDQAETVLMHWLRGSGLAGLRGMTPKRDLQLITPALRAGAGADYSQLTIASLIRPLLFVPRAEILDYCREFGLQPRFDRSNEDTTFFRNRLRHELLPFLEQYNPQIRHVLRRTAAILADDYALLRARVEAEWLRLVLEEDADRVILDLGLFRQLPASLQRSTLRKAMVRLRRNLRDIGFVHVENALAILQEGTVGNRMTLPAGLEVVLGYTRFAVGNAGLELPLDDVPQMAVDRLALATPGSTALPDTAWVAQTDVVTTTDLPSGWQANADPWQAWLDAAAVGPRPVLRVRRPGDRFQPMGMGGVGKGLGPFFTNEKVPARARDRWPLLIGKANQIAWVCGLRVDERAKITEETKEVLYVRLAPL